MKQKPMVDPAVQARVMADPDAYISLAELAEALRVSQQGVHHRVRRGRMPAPLGTAKSRVNNAAPTYFWRRTDLRKAGIEV